MQADRGSVSLWVIIFAFVTLALLVFGLEQGIRLIVRHLAPRDEKWSQ